MTQVVLIAAVARNRVIGADNALPWHLPADLRRFKRLTAGHPVVMGRRTFESIGKPLPDRTNIVLSNDPAFAAPGVVIERDLAAALGTAGRSPGGDEAVFVIGGGAVYEQAMPLADRLEITTVDLEISGDAWFPPIEPDRFTCVTAERHEPDDDHAVGFEFRTYLASGVAQGG